MLGLAFVIVAGRALLWDLRELRSWSMTPGLVAGELLLLRRVGPVQPGDVVLLHLGDDDERYVKRVVAGPGALVEEVEGRLLVDGRPLAGEHTVETFVRRDREVVELELLEERSGDRRWQVVAGRAHSDAVRVPADHWYVAGDDRQRSRDSRHWGPVSSAEIDGVVVAVLPGRHGPGGGWRGGRWLFR